MKECLAQNTARKELCDWLRENSSGSKHFTAEAARVIETLESELKQALKGFDLIYNALEHDLHDEAMFYCGYHHGQIAKLLSR